MHLLFIIAVIIVAYNLLKEVAPSKMPSNAYFDWNEYWRDIENGMSAKEQIKKQERLGYYKSRDTKK